MAQLMGLRHAEVAKVEELSPHFLRVTFSGADLADVGCSHPTLDQRIKILFDPTPVVANSLRCAQQWYSAWRELPDAIRPPMRTYSVRCWDGGVVVDFVRHTGGDLGPAARWLQGIHVGAMVLVVAPLLGADPCGIEFAPGAAREVTLVGDETALPAIARILADRTHFPLVERWNIYVEVPSAADCLDLLVDASCNLHWLVRQDAAYGELVRAQFASPAVGDSGGDLVWETPTYSASGDRLSESLGGRHYFWIAGESGMVTSLRRRLVRELGVDRASVAFMGYWKHGVAMKG